MTLFVLHGWCAPYAPAWMLFPLFSFQAAPSRPVHGWLFNASVFILIAADVHLWVSPTCAPAAPEFCLGSLRWLTRTALLNTACRRSSTWLSPVASSITSWHNQLTALAQVAAWPTGCPRGYRPAACMRLELHNHESGGAGHQRGQWLRWAAHSSQCTWLWGEGVDATGGICSLSGINAPSINA